MLSADQDILQAQKAEGMQEVAAAIASLPSLQRLSIKKQPLSLQTTATLAKAAAGTHLTQLTLQGCGVLGAGLTALAMGLSNLQELFVDVVDDGNAAIPALARLPLQQLVAGWLCNKQVLDVFLPGWRELIDHRQQPSWPGQ
jgi:ABC-type nitrate/sulfonate/bicarbonate transport system permease component